VLTDDTVVVRNTEVLSADVGAEVVLLHLTKNAYYDSNAVGGEIWQRLEAGISLGDLCHALAEKYEVDPDICRRDTEAFLEGAIAEGLVIIKK
jgi:hypothetical protein